MSYTTKELANKLELLKPQIEWDFDIEYQCVIDETIKRLQAKKYYEVHNIGGEWEDSFDYICGRFENRGDAESYKTLCEKQDGELEEQAKLCNECPIYCHNSKEKNKTKKPCFKPYEDENGIDENECGNYVSSSLYEDYYKIEEVEVYSSVEEKIEKDNEECLDEKD